MKIESDFDCFRVFPYPSDGKGNLGGLDLRNKPELIDSIHELDDFPEKKVLIRWLNLENGDFITFGCDCGYINDVYTGYIEFAYYEVGRATINNYQKLFDAFEENIRENPKTEGYAFSILEAIKRVKKGSVQNGTDLSTSLVKFKSMKSA